MQFLIFETPGRMQMEFWYRSIIRIVLYRRHVQYDDEFHVDTRIIWETPR